MPAADSTHRFSTRVENYIRYRPDYAPEIIGFLNSECGLTGDSVIADIGSGTGILTRLFLENGNRVFGVEPNKEMREAGEGILARNPRFTSVAGKAEETTLPNHSVDFVTAAQAAHWFDRERARCEFVRILKPGGWTVLVWNERRISSTPFLDAYEKLLLTYGTDYEQVRHEHTTATLSGFFAPAPFLERDSERLQKFDYAGLEGRLLSSSYAPMAGHPKYTAMIEELRRIFDAHQVNGQVQMEYRTRVFYGKLT